MIERHNAALKKALVDVEPYIANGVVVDSESYLEVMLPLARNAIAIKISERDPAIAEEVALILGLFERFCTSAAAHNFYHLLMTSPDRLDRVMNFVTLALLTLNSDSTLGTLAISNAVDKRHAKLLQDIRLLGEKVGFYDKKTKTYSDGITRTAHLNGSTKELMLPPEIIVLLMGYYINGQRILANVINLLDNKG